MFISPAYAQSAGSGGGFDMLQLLPLVLIFVVFYFLIIRPQQKKVKDHRSLVESLKRGDRIVMSGGLIGTVTKVEGERELSLQIADNVRVKVLRSMVADVIARTDSSGGEAKEKDTAKVEAKAEKQSGRGEYYRILGVSEKASAADIAAAFESHKDDPSYQDAYATLSDPVKRKLYDSLGHADYVARLKD
jgi:preprotein translocase subunit YajC